MKKIEAIGTSFLLIVLLLLSTNLISAKEIVISTNKEDFAPEEILIITPKLIESGNILEGSINIKLFSKERRFPFLGKQTILLEETVQSGKETMHKFARGTLPGEYIIEASFEEVSVRKTIFVQKLEKLDFKIENGILTISNTGNVPYKKPLRIEFEIQGQVSEKIIMLNLGIGETKEFRLEAPKGTYNIRFGSGPTAIELNSVPLTGNVIATIEIEKPEQKRNNILLALMLLIIAIILAVLYVKDKQKNEPRKVPEIVKVDKRIEKEQVVLRPTENVDKEIKLAFNRHASKLAAQAIIPSLVYGTKQEISVLLVQFSGFEQFKELKKKSPEGFNKIFDRYFEAVTEKIRSHQGIADFYGNNLLVFFNIIKNYRHDVAAIRTAEEIREITNAFNESIKGIGAALNIKAGINTGFAFVSNIGEDKTVRYTSIGNTVSLAKALVDKAFAGEILVPENVYKRVSGVISAKKILPLHLTDTEAIEVYSVKDTANLKEKHEWFIRRALGKS